MVEIKTTKEIETMRQGGQILAHVLTEVSREIKPGVNLRTLDNLAEKLILGYGAKPSFKGYRPSGSAQAYPASLCVSLNHEVVHGVPDSRALKNGDVVGLDLGVFYNGYHTDAAVTVGVGRLSEEAGRLISITKEALNLAILEIKDGVYWGDVAALIQEHVESAGFSVVRELTGHGIGRNLQEEPSLSNYGRESTGILLKKDMVIAVEPMVTAGRPQVEIGADGFVYQTKDKSLAAHFEHTLAVTASGADILTKI